MRILLDQCKRVIDDEISKREPRAAIEFLTELSEWAQNRCDTLSYDQELDTESELGDLRK